MKGCGSVVEHTLGKGEVTSSNLVRGFWLTLQTTQELTKSHVVADDQHSANSAAPTWAWWM